MAIDAAHVYSAKELEHEFTEMVKSYQDKETEYNWEARERIILRLKAILRGNAPEAYLDTIVQGIKQMVDGMIKAVESLRTQLAVKALSLVADIGVYIGKHLDSYIYDQLLMCLMRCAGVTKKMVSSASLQATITFLKHATFYPKFINMLTLSMNEKNTQVRLFTMHYTKTVLQTHAHRENIRLVMDRTSCTDQIESLINKGLNDPTPSVKELCRESFWIFHEHWKIRGEHLLQQLPPAAQKQLEKSKKSETRHLPEILPSPSTSARSSGSIGSVDRKQPSPPPAVRKTRVPLNKKKSTVGLNKRKALNPWSLLTSDDPALCIDGLNLVAKKLGAIYPYSAQPDIEHIQLENGLRPISGEALKELMLQYLKEPTMQDALSSPDCVTLLMLRLLTFDEYIPRLILLDSPALVHAKEFLNSQHPNLVQTLFTSLLLYGGFGSQAASQKEYKLPANRRKLTKAFLIWIDELVGKDGWFDLNLRQALDILVPLVLTSGTLWHADLISLLKRLRLVDQTLFDSLVVGYDECTKICRVLGIHLRLDPSLQSVSPEKQPMEEIEQDGTEQSAEQLVIPEVLIQTEKQTQESREETRAQTREEQLEKESEGFKSSFQKTKPSQCYLQEIKEEMTSSVRSLDSLSEEEYEEKMVLDNKKGDLEDVIYKQMPDYFQANLSPLPAYSNGDDQGMPTEQSVKGLLASEPNREKYPEPRYVTFFSPEKVNNPCAIFGTNTRSNSVGMSVRKDKTVLLYALIDKLAPLSVDNMSTLSKLTRLLKELPIRRRWDQGGSEEMGSETWAGGNGDGGNFVELVQSLLPYLDQPVNKWTPSALDCTCQLAASQSGLLKFFERKPNEKGMTLESQLIERLLELRSHSNPSICIAAEETLESVLCALSPPTAFEVLMAFIIYRSVILPYNDSDITKSKYHPVGSAFNYISKLVKELNDVFYIEEWLTKGAVNAFFKGINSPLINVRKACVEAIVGFHEVIQDDIYVCLADLREDQTNLIRHYTAKSLKKKASVRNMRETHQFL